MKPSRMLNLLNFTLGLCIPQGVTLVMFQKGAFSGARQYKASEMGNFCCLDKHNQKQIESGNHVFCGVQPVLIYAFCFLISGYISVLSFLKMFSLRVFKFNYHFYLSLHWISLCTDQAENFSFSFFKGFRREERGLDCSE